MSTVPEPTRRREAPRALAIIANAVFTAAAIALVAGLIWAIVRASVYPPGAMNAYYVCFTAGIVLCLFAFRLGVEARAKAALATLSIAMSLYVLEIGLTILRPTTNAHASAAAAVGADFDLRSKSEFLADLKERGRTAHPLVPPIILAATNGLESIEGDRLFPLGNISRELVVDCNETGSYSVFESDEHGFDNPMGSYDDEIDVVLIGDSFGIGSCVDPGEDIADRLRTSEYRVLNLSNASNGPLLNLAALLEYGLQRKPRIVLWLYFEGNDPSDLLQEARSPLLLRYLEGDFSQDLVHRQAEIDRVLEAYIERLAGRPPKKSVWSTPVSIAKLTELRRIAGLELPALELSPLFSRVIERASSETKARGGDFYFVYLPDWTRYGSVVRRNLVHRDHVLQIVRELGIPIVDLHPTFASQPDPLDLFPFRVRGHYSRDGYALVAKELLSALRAGQSGGGGSAPSPSGSAR